MTDYDRLDALAAAATPGPWRATPEQRNGWSGVYRSAPGSLPVFLTNAIEGSDRDFIAKCDPATIRELVAAARERDELRAALLSEDEIAHGEAWEPSKGGLGVCAYCDDEWPCRTQRGINRALHPEAGT